MNHSHLMQPVLNRNSREEGSGRNEKKELFINGKISTIDKLKEINSRIPLKTTFTFPFFFHIIQTSPPLIFAVGIPWPTEICISACLSCPFVSYSKLLLIYVSRVFSVIPSLVQSFFTSSISIISNLFFFTKFAGSRLNFISWCSVDMRS